MPDAIPVLGRAVEVSSFEGSAPVLITSGRAPAGTIGGAERRSMRSAQAEHDLL